MFFEHTVLCRYIVELTACIETIQDQMPLQVILIKNNSLEWYIYIFQFFYSLFWS